MKQYQTPAITKEENAEKIAKIIAMEEV